MRILTLLVIVFLMASCRSTKKIQTAIAKKDTVLTVVNEGKNDTALFIQSTLQKLEAGKLDYKTFTAKINVDYRDAEDKKYDVNANVRMYKDSAIWISVNALLGIEGLRALITKDSVKILDKQNKVYIARRVDYLQEVTSLPLNLQSLQNLIVGNPVFLDSNVISYSKQADNISILSMGEWFKHLLTLSENNFKVQRSKLDDADKTKNRTADLTYNDYESKQGVLFSTKRQITIVEKKKLDIRLDFKQYAFNEEVSFPFNIPKNYKYD